MSSSLSILGTRIPPYNIRTNVHSQAAVSQNYANDFSFTQIVNIIAPKSMLSQARERECACLFPIKCALQLQ